MLSIKLKNVPQFVCWKAESRNGEGKLTKVLKNPHTGGNAMSNNPSTWGTYQEAKSAVTRFNLDGIGFVFTENDSFCGIDLDHCRDPQTGAIEPWALDIIKRLGSYTEVSPSGTGVHIIVEGKLLGEGRKKGNVEMHDCLKYFTITDNHLPGTPKTIEKRQEELEKLHAEIFRKQEPVNLNPPTLTKPLDLSDAELIEKARNAENGGKFQRLWNGDYSGYPSQSEADLALANILAFWCRNDAQHIDRLFRNSGLYREKWDESHFSDGKTYGQGVIDKAIANTHEVYEPGSIPKHKPDSSTTSGEQEETGRKKSQADLLIEIGRTVDELFHDDTGEAYASIGGINYKLRSKAFKAWLRREHWNKHEKAANSDAINAALGVLEGIACFEGKQYRLDVRVAEHEGATYYDLCTDNAKAVKIMPGSWQIVEKPPILFKRYPHQKSQVTPVPGGDVKKLFKHVNVKQDDQPLFIARLIACFIPGIPRPIEFIHGEKGSAKTTTQRIERRLVDPSRLEILSFPASINELVQILAQHYYPAFDNVDYIGSDISDCLCRAVTGEGFSKRMLYTDDEAVVFSYRRCIALNGINVVARKPDLLDRGVITRLDRIPPEQRKEDLILWEAFEQDLPEILGGIFDVLSKAMMIYPTIELTRMYRMADFTRWGCAIAKALGHATENFLKIYGANIGRQNEEAIDASPVATSIIEFMKERDFWNGSPTALYEELASIAEVIRIDMKARSWPKAPNALSRRINEVMSNLLEAGIKVVNDKDGGGARVVSIQKVAKSTAGTAVTDETAGNGHGGTYSVISDTEKVPPYISPEPTGQLTCDFDSSRRYGGTGGKNRNSLEKERIVDLAVPADPGVCDRCDGYAEDLFVTYQGRVCSACADELLEEALAKEN